MKKNMMRSLSVVDKTKSADLLESIPLLTKSTSIKEVKSFDKEDADSATIITDSNSGFTILLEIKNN